MTLQVFMDTQLQCAQCHDHPYAAWTEDFYHLAAFTSAKPSKPRHSGPQDCGSTACLEKRSDEERKNTASDAYLLMRVGECIILIECCIYPKIHSQTREHPCREPRYRVPRTCKQFQSLEGGRPAVDDFRDQSALCDRRRKSNVETGDGAGTD